ncbi:DoxX family protein [Mucilaginibacter gilvus]|uniref:DoxX family protein n=1 Tax=Mucilaginibacter gilvus TaxID=2305909 RepID=A0A3S3VDG2_9SPHI|nr:hypothetical protein [Mucilaginibacter gilvus]RWY45992.1 hypothetical protein EPL05_23370 [Mucilaginibacter gilvus]
MDKLTITGKWFYAAAFIIFGIQHFMYAGFVATLVPAWIPWHLFWAYFVGVAFIMASISIIINKYALFSSVLLGLMLAMFIVLIHIPNLVSHPQEPQRWTRAVQDVAIMGTALMLAGELKLQTAGKYLFAVPIIILALQHFTHTSFVTAKVPAWFTGVEVWDYIVGIVMIIAVVGIMSNRYMGAPALILAILLLTLALLYHVPLLLTDVHNGQQWTGAMLDIAIAGGAFIVAALPTVYYKPAGMAT